jgi:hypothetical protein
MVTRRIAVEEAFVTPEIMAQWHVVLAGRDVEPGFAKMGETILAQTLANMLLDDRLLDIGAGSPLTFPTKTTPRPNAGRCTRRTPVGYSS